MKYIWLFMLVFAYLMWGIFSFKDFMYCRKTFKRPLDHVEEYTHFFILMNISVLFGISLFMWLKSKLG